MVRYLIQLQENLMNDRIEKIIRPLFDKLRQVSKKDFETISMILTKEHADLMTTDIASALRSKGCVFRDEGVVVDEDLLKELRLLKSYFKDTKEVVLHKNDIKWGSIDKALSTANILKVKEGLDDEIKQ